MFVRWNVKERRDGSTSLTAVLIESKRINGKSRQTYIGTLGTIRKERLSSHSYRHIFWVGVEDRLPRIVPDPNIRRHIENKINKTVLRPTSNRDLFSKLKERIKK